MKKIILGLILVNLCFAIKLDRSDKNVFNEELLIRPLPSGHVYSHFEFTTLWTNDAIRKSINNLQDFEFTHYNLFPRPLGEIIERYHVRELHLTLTQGLWRYQKWGYPILEAPPGAQLWVWFNPNTPNLDQTWKDLVNALSGLFCASLNFIDATNTVSPELSFRPQGISEQWYSGNSSYMRYAALPRENVCTENLTPWKKLLPCDTKAGLSTLLHPTPLYSAHYHSLALNFRPTCSDLECTKPTIEIVQSLSLVQKFLHDMDGRQDWTFKKLFSAPLISVCPLATTSKVYVDITGNEDLKKFNLIPAPHSILTEGSNTANRSLAVYDTLTVIREDIFNLQARYKAKHIYGIIPVPPLQVSRFITGHGQESGSITVKLTNSGTTPLAVIYLEVLPWYLRLYFHPSHSQLMKDSMYVSKLVTARDRERGWLYEVIVKVQAKSTVELKLEFHRALLKWLEYPPDANHGFYLPSAVFSTILPSAKNISVNRIQTTSLAEKLKLMDGPSFVRIVSETMLVSLPTPDFSMPYNVICLACTVVALAFGPIHNITTKRLTKKKKEEKPFLGKDIFTKFITKVKSKLCGAKKQVEEEIPSEEVIVEKNEKEVVLVEKNPAFEEDFLEDIEEEEETNSTEEIKLRTSPRKRNLHREET